MRTLGALLLLIGPAAGQQLVYQQVLSGNGSDQPNQIAIDSDGFVYIAGVTTSTNFPLTGALETQLPQTSIEVSVNGAPFVGLPFYASVGVVAASSDGNLILASTSNGIYRSTDRGGTWTLAAMEPGVAGQPPGTNPVSVLVVDPVNPANAYASLLNGPVYTSSDGGNHWTVGGPAPHGGFSKIIIDPQTPSTLYGFAWGFNTIYRSTDSAQSWQQLPVALQGSPYLVSAFALSFSQPNVMYAGGEGTPIIKSTDGGSAWTAGANGLIAAGPDGLAVDPADPNTLWIVEGGLSILRSTDGGMTFQTVASLAPGSPYGLGSVLIDPANSSHVYASSPLDVYQTTDGGVTWAIAFAGPASLYAVPSRIYAASSSPNTVFLAKFDPSLSQVLYATYLWSGAVSGIALDGAGGVYVAGTENDFLTGIVIKVGAQDRGVVYSTVLNGAPVNAIAANADGTVVVAGGAFDLNTTPGAYETNMPGPCNRPAQNVGGIDEVVFESTHAFAAKLDPNGAVVYATYIGGSCGDAALGLALDSSGAAYVSGQTDSLDFPVTPNATIGKFSSTYTSGFISELSPAGDQLLYSSFVGGGGYTTVNTVKLDGIGNLYLAGSTQATPTAGAVTASGTIGCPPPPLGIGPTLVNLTQGENAFVMKLTPSATPPAFLATVGGSCGGTADSIAFDSAGNIWLAGSNGSSDFATKAPIAGLLSRSNNGFLAELDPTASTLVSATLTDEPGAVAVGPAALYYTGGQIKDSSGDAAATVTSIETSSSPSIFIDEVVRDNPLGLSSQPGPSPVAPGEIVRILGRGIGPAYQRGAQLTAGGILATSIDGAQVTFNGVPTPLLWVQANQIVCIAPFELNGLTSAAVEVHFKSLTSNTYTVPVVAQNPDILAVVNSNWTANSRSNPATNGVTIFLTGLGQTNPPGVDGAINQPPLAQPVTVPVIGFTGNYAADVTFLGAAAFEVAGVSQLNLVPTGPLTPPSPAGPVNTAFTVLIGNQSVIVYLAP